MHFNTWSIGWTLTSFPADSVIVVWRTDGRIRRHGAAVKERRRSFLLRWSVKVCVYSVRSVCFDLNIWNNLSLSVSVVVVTRGIFTKRFTRLI